MVAYSKVLHPVRGLCRHIPSLLSLAAVVAQTRVDLDAVVNGSDGATCSNRSMMNQKLLDWCDDFYGDLADDPEIQTGDVAWIKQSVSPIPTTAFSRTLQQTEHLLSVLDHMDFSESAEAVLVPLTITLTRCTQVVVRDHFDLLPSYKRMIARLYSRAISRYGAQSFMLSRIMKCVLEVSVPRCIRDLLHDLDPMYQSNIERLLKDICDEHDVWLFGINSGRLDLAVQWCSSEVRIRASQQWRVAACYTGDMDIVSEVMCPAFLSRDDAVLHLHGEDRLELIRIAVRINCVELVRFLFQRTSGGFGVDCMNVWADVRDVEMAMALNDNQFPYDGAVPYCHRSAPVLQFLLANGARCEPTLGLCAYCDYGPFVVDVLVQCWKRSATNFDRFVTVALHECVTPNVLRQLVRVVGGSVQSDVLKARRPQFLLNGRRSDRTVAYMKACVQLGACVNAIDVVSGQSALVYAGELQKIYAVQYLLSVGAACDVRDRKGLNVYDYLVRCTRRFM